MPNSRIKRDIDWFFESPGLDISVIRGWEEDDSQVEIPVSVEQNKFVLVPVYWEDSAGAPSLTGATLGGIPGTILLQDSTVTTFGNGIAFVYWTDAQYNSLPALADPVFIFSSAPDTLQYSSVVYANVHQTSIPVDSGSNSNNGDLNFSDTLTAEDGGVAVVANVSGTSSANTVTTCTFPNVIDETDEAQQNANVYQQLPTTAPSEGFTFTITGSNRTVVLYISLRRA